MCFKVKNNNVLGFDLMNIFNLLFKVKRMRFCEIVWNGHIGSKDGFGESEHVFVICECVF